MPFQSQYQPSSKADYDSELNTYNRIKTTGRYLIDEIPACGFYPIVSIIVSNISTDYSTACPYAEYT